MITEEVYNRKICPICIIEHLHPRVEHNISKCRTIMKFSVCDTCKSEVTDSEQHSWNVAREI